MDESNAPVCLITGGTSGVGLATAIRFSKEKYRVAICGRDSERLAAAKSQLEQAGAAEALTVLCDLSQNRAAISLADEVIDRFGRIDVLMNNAAVAPLGKLDETTDDAFEEAVNINIRSVFYLTRQVWKSMKEQGSGTIVNMSSLAAVDPFPGFSVYGSSKAWIDLFTVALGNEGKESGIQVFSIRAGAVETPMLRGLFPDFPADQAIAPQKIADVVWNLHQDELKSVSGQPIIVKQ